MYVFVYGLVSVMVAWPDFYRKYEYTFLQIPMLSLTSPNYSLPYILIRSSLPLVFAFTNPSTYKNNFGSDDCILIIRTFLNKSKRLLNLLNDYKINKDLNKTISNAKPPIFWKEKEIVKQQIKSWSFKEIENLIYQINTIELLIKKYSYNSINILFVKHK